MYSTIKYNGCLASKTRNISKGLKLRKYHVRSVCPLCSPLNPKILSRSLSIYNFNFKPVCYGYEPSTTALSFQNTSIPILGLATYNRNLHTSTVLFASEPLKPSSKVEETVTALKEKAKEKLQEGHNIQNAVVAAPKKSLKQKIIDEVVHYYHGFRLLFIDINVSRKLVWQILNGNQLTRREHKLLIRTVGDMFRLIPFSVFIIVPFMELALPLFIKFFPGMLPSTFQTSSDKENKIKKNLKVKLDMAKFLQQTLDEMAVSSKSHSSKDAKEFAEFFQKIRTSGVMTTSDDIMKFSKLFEDEITLDNLPRPQLMALCRVLEMNPIGTTNFLRFQLRLKLRSLTADDKMIQKEGINSLSVSELQAACRARGMRALGVYEERLKAQLAQWLDLSLIKKVPPSLLLLTQAFMFPDTTSTEQKLAATIQALPDVVATATKAVIGEREGKVDYKTKVEIMKEELEKIKEERIELQAEEIKTQQLEAEKLKEEAMVDPAPTLMGSVNPALQPFVDDIKKAVIKDQTQEEDVTSEDIAALETALEQKLLFEKESLADLRQEMLEYEEDINDLKTIVATSQQVEVVKETKAAKRLFTKVNKMISKMDNVLAKLEEAEQKTKDPQDKDQSDDKLRIDELIDSIKKIQGVSESASLERLSEVLNKLDADRDGLVRVDLLLKMLDIVGDEGVKLNKKQVNELVELLDKEETLEMDIQIIKALKKDDYKDLKKEFEQKKKNMLMKLENEKKELAMLKEGETTSLLKIAKKEQEKSPIVKSTDQKEINLESSKPVNSISNEIPPVAVASNSNKTQTEITAKTTITLEEPKSSSSAPKDLR